MSELSLNIIITFTIISILSTIIIFITYWSVHRYMTIRYSNNWAYCNFKIFKREFEKIKWREDDVYTDSLFDKDSCSEIHAGIIKFNDNGMVIDLLSYIKYLLFIHRYLKNKHILKKYKKDLWV